LLRIRGAIFRGNACSEDLLSVQQRRDADNATRRCFCAPPLARRTASSTITGASWRIVVSLAVGWCGGTCCIWGRSTRRRSWRGANRSKSWKTRARPRHRAVRAVSRRSLRKGTRWDLVLFVLTAYRLIDLYVTLGRQLESLAPGLTSRSALEKFAAVQMVDVRIPTTDGRELLLTRSNACASNFPPSHRRKSAPLGPSQGWLRLLRQISHRDKWIRVSG
jgi:hypothetical protein